MSEEYRKQIEAEIAEANAEAANRRSPEQLDSVVADRNTSTDERLEALDELIKNADFEIVHERILPIVADDSEEPEVRQTALQGLKVATMASPTSADWRADYLDALRSATQADDMDLRVNAFEVLAAERDEEAQEMLISGLEESGPALVPAEQALRMLADDPHARTREVAHRYVEESDDPTVRLEAVRVLSGDPDSLSQVADRLVDPDEHPEVRKVAATGVGNLEPELLEALLDEAGIGDYTAGEDEVLDHAVNVLRQLD